MTSGVERVYRRASRTREIYREIYLHWIHWLDENGTIVSSKLDKETKGGLWIPHPTQRSSQGEASYTFPGDENPTRLIALRGDWDSSRYGPPLD
jgi:hypothetical protein